MFKKIKFTKKHNKKDNKKILKYVFFVYISLCNKQDNTARSQNNMRGLHQALCNMRHLAF